MQLHLTFAFGQHGYPMSEQSKILLKVYTITLSGTLLYSLDEYILN